jgi:hypothetical protein
VKKNTASAITAELTKEGGRYLWKNIHEIIEFVQEKEIIP